MSSLPGGQEAEVVPEAAWGGDAGRAAARATLVLASLCDRGAGFLCNEDLWLHGT